MFNNGSVLEAIDPKVAGLLKALSLCGVGSTYGAEQQAFENWARAHPEEWTESSSVGVVVALRGTWPCVSK